MATPETAYSEIETIIQRFKNTPLRERKAMNEPATRQGFILPLFRALGWDIDNINEVKPEDKVSRGYVDYSFRIGGVPRFFLETKRADEDLTNPQWVRQAIDYAWTKSVTWALLSDFEGLIVFNAEAKTENPLQARFFDFNLDTYLSKFEQLWWLSREQTALGKLDTEADKFGRINKRLPVSQELFADLKKWRELLFNDIKLHNPIFPPADIDNAILHLLNRLIFIRTAEDRLVESNRLRAFVREMEDRKQFKNWGAELSRLFREMDGIYNSELFAPHFSDGLEFTPAELKKVIEGLYQKHYILYNFNALEADVLGTVYEQYLGAVVANKSEEETKPKKGAKQPELISEGMTVQERRVKRKSQGIYYTPSFVTKYIVHQTVGRYLDEHGYNPSKPPHILDMACGSGSFLIEAFDMVDDFVAKQKGHARNGELDFYDRMRQIEVLENCIFGVDKDKQALEVARLNLLLRALHSRDKLPKLENNFHLGDSLKAETWEIGFSRIVKDGGFDVVIGNPPYVRQETLGEEFKVFAKQNFETFTGMADLYIYFIEQAHKLLKPNGLFGMIVSNKWIRANYGKALRDYLKRESALVEIVDFGELPVFENASTFPVIIITRKAKAEKQNFLYAPIKRLDFAILSDEIKNVGTNLDERSLQGENWTLAGDQEQSVLEKMREKAISLDEYVDGQIYRGVVTGANEVFVVSRSVRDRLVSEDPKSVEIIKPFIIGDDVRKYHFNFSNHFLIFARRGIEINEYPAIKKYLTANKERLIPKPSDWKGDWNGRKSGRYQWFEIQDTVEYYPIYDKPKIIYPVIASESRFTFDREGYYANDKTFSIPYDDLYLLGLLNSKVIWLYLKRTCSVLGDPDKGGRLELRDIHMKTVPIRRIDFANPAEKSAHDDIVKLVRSILVLQKERQSFEPGRDFDEIQNVERKIKSLDDEIDQGVYQLYGLTEEDIKIVEGK